ncbi:MAG: ADOP family duplicated permease [Gemmatimonadales bacterium]
MPAIRTVGRQLKSLIWRDSIAEQVEAELDFHLEMLTRELMESGLSREAAYAQAVQRFGDLGAVASRCRKIGLQREREIRRTEYLDELRQDAGHALRQLRKAPGFAAVAILTLALAIGANTAIFSVVSAVLLRPLPYPAADRLTVLWAARGDQKQNLVSIPDVKEWRDRNRTFEDIEIVRSQSVNLTGGDAPDRLVGSFITAGTLRLLGARASIGRLFTEEETTEGSGQQVTVLSHGVWKTRFGSDPRVLGRTLTLNGRPHVVIGVTTPDFQDPFGQQDIWLPITSAPNPAWFTRDNPSVWAVGRLKPGVTLEQAQRDLSIISRQLAKEYPATNAGYDASVFSMRDNVVGQVRPALLIVLGFVGVVLLIACANVANLQLARAASRRSEISLRAALGAGRGRLVRQVLTESLVLSVIGGGAGLALAYWMIRSLVAAVPGGLPVFGGIGLDRGVLLFSAAITIATGLLFGIMPALHAARADLGDSLRSRGSDGPIGGRGDVRNAFVAVQLALCIVLLVGAGLLTRSLTALQRVDLGFDPEKLLTAEFRLPATKYNSPEKIDQFMTQALGAIRAVPGIRSAALLNSVPLSGNWATTGYLPAGQAEPGPGLQPTAQINGVTDGYFRTMGIPLLEGREFEASDRADSPPVAIVNQELARRAWPNQSALGKQLKIFGLPDVGATIVGVVGSVKQFTLGEPAGAQLYQPKSQSSGIFASVAARTDGDPMALGDAMRSAIWSVDPEQPVWKIRSMRSLVDRDLAPQKFTTLLTGSFALLALLLAAVGVYGVMSYAVAQRTREIGIRMALGAARGQVVRMVLGRGARIVAVAAGLGLLIALGAARLLRSQLFGVAANDLLTFATVPLGLAFVALLACYLPARRAAGVDPVIALRNE